MTKRANSVETLGMKLRSSGWVGSAFVLLYAGLTACSGEGQRPRTDRWATPAPNISGSGSDATAPSSNGIISTGSADGTGEPSNISIDESGPAAPLVPRSSLDLSALFPADAELVGIAIASTDSGTTSYVLEARTGLYELGGNQAKLVFDLKHSRVLAGTGDGSPPAELTDVTIDPRQSFELGAPSFLLTGENDGYSLTLPDTSLTSYFCYLPRIESSWNTGGTPSVSQLYREQGIAVSERTDAVAVSEESEEIFAQPRTTRMDSAAVVGSELFAFDTAGGQPTTTRQLNSTEFAAGGAAFLPNNTLWLGYQAGLYATTGWNESVRLIGTVPGVDTITGLAVDPTGNLFVLDGPHRRLVELDGNDLTALSNRSEP